MISSIAKRLFDATTSFFLLLLLSPLFILISLAIKIDSKGDIFFKQIRLGKDTKAFTMLKFRTMVTGAESMNEGLFNYQDDPRVTRVGSWLRNSSLDELPQLFNILIGDMSIVGPRPPVHYELGDISEFDPTTRKRFEVKPGVTGLAQISGRNELSWNQKIELDNKYVDNWNRVGMWCDMPILFQTIIVVFSNSGAHERESNRDEDLQRLKPEISDNNEN